MCKRCLTLFISNQTQYVNHVYGQFRENMKYTSIITAAAVLSASTFVPFQAKFSIGVEGSHFSLEVKEKLVQLN